MTLFHTESTAFPTSAVSTPPVSSCPCAEQVIPTFVASDTLWFPLDEAVYAWTTFCTLTMHNAALVATGTALLALSWEQTALRHYTQAQHRLRFVRRTDNDVRSVSLLLEQTLRNLSEATNRWQRVILWLDRLANAHEDPPDAAVLDTIRDLYRQAMAFQHRLWTLAGSIQQEQMQLAHPLMERNTPKEEGGRD